MLVEQGLASSRTVAQRLIAAGHVSYDQGLVSKSSLLLPADTVLVVAQGDTDGPDRYVGRGGLKLAGALAHTGLDVRGLVCLDVGQSTGGFTDCLLQAGAARVVGIDVGHGQLHSKLRADARVSCIEGINARHLEAETVGGEPFQLIVGDLSFISLTLVLPKLAPLLAREGELLMLVKPQFEVGLENIGKGGIVRDTSLYPMVEAKLRACCGENKLRVLDWFESSITGTDGNHEFFILCKHET
jgi:23S rRNA (cytidine1920-2'-O)/16S rRNA (cytidine1409-2'-O)-methyltransferase